MKKSTDQKKLNLILKNTILLLLHTTTKTLTLKNLSKEIPHCWAYSKDKKTCKMCQIGYYIEPQKKTQCLLCSSGCKLCNDDTDCTTCFDSYFLKENLCYSCPDQCSKCNNFDKCTACIPHYILFEDKKCIKPTNDDIILERVILGIVIFGIFLIICCAIQKFKKKEEAQMRMKERRRRVRRKRETAFGDLGVVDEEVKRNTKLDKDEKTVRWLANKRVFKEDILTGSKDSEEKLNEQIGL